MPVMEIKMPKSKERPEFLLLMKVLGKVLQSSEVLHVVRVQASSILLWLHTKFISLHTVVVLPLQSHLYSL
jgi:hypothetical protein